MSLNQSPDIVRIANTLGIHQNPRPVEAIVAYCMKRVGDWVGEMGGADSLEQLERIVCAKLRLKFEYINSDEDLARIRETYLAKGEQIIRKILDDMDAKTFGAVFRRRHATGKDRDLYVAVIDCRGEKLARKFFTKWHEIAHLLTPNDNQMEFIFQRNQSVKKPEEQLMDVIAGKIGFYPPIFRRAFNAELAAFPRFSFGLVQRVRDNVCSDASFQATLHACLEAYERPCLLVRAELALTKAEQDQVAGRQSQLFPQERPLAVLRAVAVHRNDAARAAKFHVHENMRIPEKSRIFHAYQELARGGGGTELPCFENLDLWQHSDGRGLPTREVAVYTRAQGKALLALVIAAQE